MHYALFILAAAAPTAPTPAGTPTWVTILVAVIAMLGGTLGWEVYKRWRKGTQEDALEISQAAIEQARGAKDLFIEYRVELEAAQKQIAQYLDQLIQVNRSLGEAQGRIARLEAELLSAHTESKDIRDQLNLALRERERQNVEREKLIEEIAGLQERIKELETRNRNRINEVRNNS